MNGQIAAGAAVLMGGLSVGALLSRWWVRPLPDDDHTDGTGGGAWRLARVLCRRRRARRVLDDLAVHLNTAAAMNPDLRAGFDRLQAAAHEQQNGDQA